jgi:hypothetical protein
VASSFNDIDIDVGESKPPSINKSPSSATWSSYTDFDYTITLGSQYVSFDTNTHKFVGIKRGTENDTYPIMVSVTATHKTTGLTDTFDIKVNKNAIIVIPGIFGSELYVGNDNPYFKPYTSLVSDNMIDLLSVLTSTISNTVVFNMFGHMLLEQVYFGVSDFVNMYYDSLKCNDDGSPKYEVYTKKYVYVADDTNEENSIYTLPSGYDERYYTTNAGLFNTYYDLIHALYQEDDITSQYFIEFFSYDWRLSNAASADKLDEFIEDNGYDKVILIAHSMGGLVASGYMSMGADQLNKTKGVYMLSSPLEGTPEVINVWANEDFSFLTNGAYEGWISFGSGLLAVMTLSLNPIQKLMGNYASIYELFPTQNYLSISSTPYLTHYISTTVPIIGTTTETVCNSYSTSMHLISGYLPHFNATLMAAAEEFHDSCRNNNRHITYSVDCKYLYTASEYTTTQLRYFERISPGSYNSYGISIKTSEMVGDSLVPSWSATVGRSGNNVQSYSGGHMYTISNSIPIGYIINSLK